MEPYPTAMAAGLEGAAMETKAMAMSSHLEAATETQRVMMGADAAEEALAAAALAAADAAEEALATTEEVMEAAMARQ